MRLHCTLAPHHPLLGRLAIPQALTLFLVKGWPDAFTWQFTVEEEVQRAQSAEASIPALAESSPLRRPIWPEVFSKILFAAGGDEHFRIMGTGILETARGDMLTASLLAP